MAIHETYRLADLAAPLTLNLDPSAQRVMLYLEENLPQTFLRLTGSGELKMYVESLGRQIDRSWEKGMQQLQKAHPDRETKDTMVRIQMMTQIRSQALELALSEHLPAAETAEQTSVH